MKTHTDIPGNIGSPAGIALKAAGITTLRQVAKLTEKELLALHGVGPKAVRILREALESKGMAFITESDSGPGDRAAAQKAARSGIASRRPNGSEQVSDHIERLDHPLKPAMREIRELILDADKGITEHIKWKSPSFCHGGDDRITYNIRPNGELLLVFHRGARAKDRKGEGRLIDDKTGMLKWITDDRATITIRGLDDLNKKKADLKALVRQWIDAAGS
jgi:hypothetical protein